MAISFKDKVVIVTGAGAGLGRSHALEFARRGAKVVVNDLGGKVDGSGGSSDAALKVVEEIKALGADAIANGASVADRAGAESIVNDVNQKYGRVVLTTSSSGLYGNFGQSNYGAAKLGLVGLQNTLKLEGAKADIRVNTIAPVAATRMTENLGIPEDLLKQLKPELISSAVVYLASDDAPTGAIIEAGAGYFAKVQIVEGKGVKLGVNATADDFAASWEKIADTSEAKPFNSGSDVIVKIFSPG
jgi:NAD(P)-dependent dehydrogenase (short-subunit alcohol dehydrogenase family)